MASLAAAYGAIKMKDFLAKTEPVYIQMFYNRLFINMTNMMDYPRHIWMNKSEDVHFAICGRTIPSLTAQPEGLWLIRFRNFLAQLIYSSRAKHHLKKLVKFTETVSIEESEDIATFYKNIENAHPAMNTGFELHLSASAQSGTVYSAFMRIMTDGKRMPSAEDHHIASLLLKNIPDIESADAVKSLDHLASEIQEDTEFATLILAASPVEALELLTVKGPKVHVEKFVQFLNRHGHRCVRESELREKTWGEDPLQIISILQTRIGIKSSKHITKTPQKIMLPADLSVMKSMILKMLLPLGRKAVARRETSKAYSIKIVDITRKAYRKLALKMVAQGFLDDADQIYFLTHEELGKLISDKNPEWKEKANRRRHLLSETDVLCFEEVCYGKPEPLENNDNTEVSEGAMQGIPVSSGFIKAKARIVNTLEEAAALQPGEIMIASFTDIGWSPYFSIIAGLITEIGSPLSHGAVVAREYGIPAVVGVKGIKKKINTGDLIELDGRKGIITKCE
jgi:pyruvate,water dikinase